MRVTDVDRGTGQPGQRGAGGRGPGGDLASGLTLMIRRRRRYILHHNGGAGALAPLAASCAGGDPEGGQLQQLLAQGTVGAGTAGTGPLQQLIDGARPWCPTGTVTLSLAAR